MRIFIAGGGGFVGSHLADYLLQQGHEVIVMDNFITGRQENLVKFLNKGGKLIKGDITQDRLPEDRFDIIYHLASPASPFQYQKYPLETLLANSQGTHRLLDLAKKHKSRFVLASTSEVYGDPLMHPQKEDYWGNVNPNGVRSCYDESKRFSESISMVYQRDGLDVRIARLFNTYGPRMEINDGRVVSNFIVQSLQNKNITVYGDGSQTRSLNYISDTIEGFYQLGFRNNLSGAIINIGNPKEQTIIEIAEIIKKMCGSKSKITFKPAQTDDPKRRKPDISKAKELLNWEPKVELSVGLEKTIAYFRSIIL